MIGLLALAGVLIALPLSDVPPGPASSPSQRTPSLELRRSNGRTTIIIDGPNALRTKLIALVDSLRSGALTVVDRKITVSGVARTGGGFRPALAALRGALSDDTELEVDVFVVDDTMDVGVLCRRMFEAVRNPTIEFRQSGSTLRTSAVGALDRIVSFAASCRGGDIVIIGHSDAMGDADYNQLLSEQRARAVADYLVRRGVDAARLIVEGRGASQPIADNDTIGGRAANRRIEFELR